MGLFLAKNICSRQCQYSSEENGQKRFVRDQRTKTPGREKAEDNVDGTEGVEPRPREEVNWLNLDALLCECPGGRRPAVNFSFGRGVSPDAGGMNPPGGPGSWRRDGSVGALNTPGGGGGEERGLDRTFPNTLTYCWDCLSASLSGRD